MHKKMLKFGVVSVESLGSSSSVIRDFKLGLAG